MVKEEEPEWAEDLPPEVVEGIRKSLREGVSFSIDRADDYQVTGINWRPGDPNALAEAIIKHVDREMPLVLDGHQYMIRPRERVIKGD